MVLTRITPDVLKALLRSVPVSPIRIAILTSLPRRPQSRMDRAFSARMFVEMAWRRSVWSSFRRASSTRGFFPQDVYFGVFGGRVDGYLLFGAVMPYAEAHNGMVKK